MHTMDYALCTMHLWTMQCVPYGQEMSSAPYPAPSHLRVVGPDSSSGPQSLPAPRATEGRPGHRGQAEAEARPMGIGMPPSQGS